MAIVARDWTVLGALALAALVGCETKGKTEDQAMAATMPAQASTSSVPAKPRGPTTESEKILERRSTQCRKCGEAQCARYLSGAESCEAIEGKAAAGPKAGHLRTELCHEALKCVLESKCAATGTGMPCYCGKAEAMDCLGTKANGVCKAQQEAALESVAAQIIAAEYVNLKLGGGRANQLVQCLYDQGCQSCF